ncbi:hypothetical protein BV25DRAFT_578397 [Artomyces pyxidatus]|uniref:Uncharacterized protein n=1 Tax=Artomyces pyxidatus TaxID=48021 RepID=A0ACB8TJ04_9AGAM|nr:hypothetical protein BV25DRAFT_578397 [Artomyces pyxidatus]
MRLDEDVSEDMWEAHVARPGSTCHVGVRPARSGSLRVFAWSLAILLPSARFSSCCCCT